MLPLYIDPKLPHTYARSIRLSRINNHHPNYMNLFLSRVHHSRCVLT